MAIVTPGIDLQPLTRGADYIYVLDKSGSMNGGKIRTLAKGVEKAIGAMRPEDRFRVISFDSRAAEVTSGWVTATPENIRRALQRISGIAAGGSTDMHSGLKLALAKLDADRATSIVLVTDGVTNTGIVSPKAFDKLLRRYDVRVFGFVMGNSANWPLMQMIGRVSGGFSAGVSNDDDIVGQIMLAKSKVTHECLHDASIRITGVEVFDVTDEYVGKVYRGQQLVLFGRYADAGRATVTLRARLTGEDKAYTTTFEFPKTDTDNPELERLWALNQIEQHKQQCMVGLLPEGELKDIERDLGVKYQLVTDETTMVVLSDEVFAQRGIERRNQARVAAERRAQSRRAQQSPRNYTVDNGRPAFPHHAPRLGGGGALDPFSVLAVLGLLFVTARRMRRGHRDQ
jgi:Ca-activated chloride channel family protein